MPLNTSPNKFQTERYDVVTTAIPNPPLGEMLVWPVPDNLVIRVVSLYFRMLTNAFVINRWAVVCLRDAALNLGPRIPAIGLQPANWAITYTMAVEYPLFSMAPIVARLGLLPSFMELKPGEDLCIYCVNMQGTDRFMDARVRYVEWKED